jgi:hypothetical protein
MGLDISWDASIGRDEQQPFLSLVDAGIHDELVNVIERQAGFVLGITGGAIVSLIGREVHSVVARQAFLTTGIGFSRRMARLENRRKRLGRQRGLFLLKCGYVLANGNANIPAIADCIHELAVCVAYTAALGGAVYDGEDSCYRHWVSPS